ncbi:hypothetical protein K6W17_03200 [Burkholderia dolosa]|nr:hypothetical protein [Burkholderia dolosa]MBY4751039.1 hypothetical protein [Burkholderia dolosa]
MKHAVFVGLLAARSVAVRALMDVASDEIREMNDPTIRTAFGRKANPL